MAKSELYTALRPLLWTSALMGVGPRGPEDPCVIKLFCYLCSCALIIIGVVVAVTADSSQLFDGCSYTATYGIIMYLILNSAASSASALTHLLQRHGAFTSVLLHIERLDRELRLVDSYCRVKTVVYSAFCITFVMYAFILGSFVASGQSWYLIIFLLFNDFPTVLNELQFVILILILGDRFRSVNENLLVTFGYDATSEEPFIRKRNFLHSETGKEINPTISNLLKLTYRTGNNCNSLRRQSKREERNERVFIIQNIHFQLVEIAEKVSSFYQVSNLLVIMLALLALVTILFDFMTTAYSEGSSAPPQDLLMIIPHFIMPASKLVALSASCHVTAVEAARTEILATGLRVHLRREEQRAKELLEQFSRQVAQTRLEFWSCYVVRIDGSLLLGIMSTVVTYIIILLQFTLSEKQPQLTARCNRTKAHAVS